jgi:hypothetical protein
MFRYRSGYFTNIRNKKVITVSGGQDKEAQPVWAWTRYGGRNSSQIWRVLYTADRHKTDQRYRKKG